jgi:Tfp pilus assembly protein PilN
MRTVNLLPLAVVEAQLRRRQLRRCLWMLGLAAAVGIVWWQAAAMQIRPLRAAAQTTTRQLDGQRQIEQELARRQTSHAGLRAAENLEAQLAEPVAPTAIIALLGQLIPERVALTKLTLEMCPLPEASPPKGGAAPAASAKPTEPRPLLMELTGVARNDADVARCISRLSEHPLFNNVKLAKSRQALDGGPPRVVFTIALEVPVHRQFITASGVTGPARAGQEVADAR